MKVGIYFRLAVRILLLSVIPLSCRAQTSPVPSQDQAFATGQMRAEDRSLVVFYRPKRFFGSGLTPSIYVDKHQMARLDNGRFFSVYLTKGSHRFESSMKHAPLEIEAKPGETIYVEMVILAGNWRGGGRLIPAPPEDATAALKKLKPLDKQWVMDKDVVFDTVAAPETQARER